jgi:hypothetical protein
MTFPVYHMQRSWLFFVIITGTNQDQSILQMWQHIWESDSNTVDLFINERGGSHIALDVCFIVISLYALLYSYPPACMPTIVCCQYACYMDYNISRSSCMSKSTKSMLLARDMYEFTMNDIGL